MNTKRTNSIAVAFLTCIVLLMASPTTSQAATTNFQQEPSHLRVTSTHPKNGAMDVTTAGEIVVIFNRPIVPLTDIDDQDALPQPLTIEPLVEGVGSWLNTSVYTFQPIFGFAGGTEYTVTVDGITGLNGDRLQEPSIFTFSTASPIVSSVTPLGLGAKPETSISVEFSQPMDREITGAALAVAKLPALDSLEDSKTPPPPPNPHSDLIALVMAEQTERIEGDIKWNEANTTLTFTPTTWLDFGARYAVVVDESAQPASRQGNLRNGWYSEFTVAPLPAVESIMPEDGLNGVDPAQSVVVRFNTAISPTMVYENIAIAPLLTTTSVYSYYADYANEFTISWFKEPQTAYTLSLGADIADNYGNTLGEAVTATFSTGDYSPFVQTNLDRFTHFSAFTETQVSVLYRNIDSLEAELFRLPEREIFKLAGENAYQVWDEYQIPDRAANRIWSRSYPPRVGRNIAAQEVISLTTENNEQLEPGTYLLEIQQPYLPVNANEDPTRPLQHVIVLGDRNLVVKKSPVGESLAWVTDLQSGLPVAKQPVRFYRNGEFLAEGVTDANGLARAALALDQDDSWAPIIVTSGEIGAPGYAIASTEWNQGIGPWEYNISSSYNADQFRSYFYTDRPIYRPGQTVHWKGIVRQIVDDAYTLPETDLPIVITLRDDRGNDIFTNRVFPNEHGSVDGSVDLSADALTGFYYLEAVLEIGEGGNENDVDRFANRVFAGTGFQVASYRKPEFEIAVTSDAPEYTHGESIRVMAQASYFSGGPLANAEVSWRVLAEPYTFAWSNGPDDRHYQFTPYIGDEDDFDPYRNGFYGGLVSEGIGTTDANGLFTVDLPADLADAPNSQRWVIDVTVQSPTNQFVSGSVRVPIHKSNFYVGIRPERYLVSQGEKSTIDFATVQPSGDPQPNQELQVTVSEYQWNSVYAKATNGTFRWQTSVERTPVATETVTTGDNGLAQIQWTPTKPGQYQIVAASQDVRGNLAASAGYVYVSGNSFVAWRRDNNDRMNLVADRDQYAPGDVAKILIPSPFAGPHKALVTIERGGILQAEVIDLTSNSETLEIPITVEQIPNVYVSVLLVKGVDETNLLPAMRLGYIQLTVDIAQKELAVEIEPSAQQMHPSDTVSYTLQINDTSGNPALNTEVSVALVDKAIFALANDNSGALLRTFYNERPLGVQTSALLAINKDRLSQQLTEGAKGGGGGGGPGLLDVREDFPDVAFWRANFVTDQNGTITFDVDLPDNLTTWVLVARAVSDKTLVGEATNEIIATKKLQIRPLLPRFFTAGDHAEIRAIIINNSDQAIKDGLLTFEISGSTIDFETNSEPFALAPGAQTEINIPVHVSDRSTELSARFAATVEGNPALQDGVQVSVPVQRYESSEVVSTAGIVPADGQRESIQLPQDATDTGELLVRLEPSLAAGMIDGLDYLEHYPYECNEQTVSRFLPNLFTQIALQKLALDDAPIERELANQLATGVQRLVRRQNADGGWGYWPSEESSPFITSYVLWGLSHAQAEQPASGQGNYLVPDLTIASAVAYLERAFVAPKDVTANWQLNEMAFTHYVLASIGQGDPGRMITLFAERERLATYGRAYLALALHEAAQSAPAKTLLDDIWASAKLSATGAFWQEETIDYHTLNTNIRTTAVALAAFTQIAPGEPLLPNVVRWLMDARKAGRWATTQENAWSIIALTEWMAATGELEADYEWDVSLNEESFGNGTATAENVDEVIQLRTAIADLLRDQANDLTFNRSSETGTLYYTTQLRYSLDAADVQSRDRGIVVARDFNLDGQRTSSAQVGDIISVTTTIIAPTDLYHVLVETPIPAGTEPINPRLLNESAVGQDPNRTSIDIGYSWRYWNPTHVDLRDDKVAFFATYLPAGTYEYTFQVRASVAGEFRVLPAFAEQMYFNEVWGRSEGGVFVIGE